MLLLTLLLFGSGHHYQPPKHFDLVELNHHYDHEGNHSYDQVIYYNWSPDYRRFDVEFWHIVGKLSHCPTNHYGRWVVENVPDRKFGASATLYRETWTFGVDPERAQKKLKDEKYRGGYSVTTHPASSRQ